MSRIVDVLLVEDNDDHIFLTKKALEKFQDTANLTVHVVKDGVQAIDFVNKNAPHEAAPTPDLILLDIKLPNKNGFEVLARLKGDERHRRIPVVMLTSSDADVDVEQSYELGSNSYISKPIRTDELFKKLANIPDYWININALPPKTA